MGQCTYPVLPAFFVPGSRVPFPVPYRAQVKTNLEGQFLIRIAVIDGQGAGIGSTIIRKIRQAYGEKVEIWALGTNAIAPL